MSTTATLRSKSMKVSDRTLRRSIERGTIHGRRNGSHRFVPASGEKDYLEKHWEQLALLRKLLGAKPAVRLAVLYGSFARGDDTADSDIDLIIKFSAPPTWEIITDLSLEIEEKLQKEVDIADWEHIYKDAPLLLLQAIDDGRVLVDKDKYWPEVKEQRAAVYARAERGYQKEKRHLEIRNKPNA